MCSYSMYYQFHYGSIFRSLNKKCILCIIINYTVINWLILDVNLYLIVNITTTPEM